MLVVVTDALPEMADIIYPSPNFITMSAVNDHVLLLISSIVTRSA